MESLLVTAMTSTLGSLVEDWAEGWWPEKILGLGGGLQHPAAT